MNVDQAVIIAGGMGTRLGKLAETCPKALVNVAGLPLVEHQISVARRYGINRLLILTGHLGDMLADHLGNGERFGVEITYRRERQPLGTAGALRNAEDLLAENFFVFYGDIVFDVDLDRIVQFYRKHNSLATLVVHPNDHPFDSDTVEIDGDNRIVAFHTKKRPTGSIVRNLVNAGIYLLSRNIILTIESGKFADFGLDVFPQMLKAGDVLTAYNTPEYIKDSGTADRLAEVEHDILSGKMARRNLSCPQRAVFLDRDGVIIKEKGDRVTFDQVQLLPSVTQALSGLNESDFLSIVVTNQPGIAKGFLSETDTAQTHNQIDTMLGKEHCYVNDYFICPHHPDRGFPGERPELKVACDCRKPSPGLLLRAAKRLNIDLGASFMVGDRTIDIAAGLNAGVCTIGVRTGYGCADGRIDVEPDFICNDLSSAISLILDHQSFLGRVAELAKQLADGGSGMVAVGGLSRTGKSVFAQMLRWQLRRQQRHVEILRLDDFLRPERERKELPKVCDRYNTPAIIAAIDNPSRQAGTILIIEGVIALALPAVRDRSGVRVYIAIDEAIRRERFLVGYRERDYGERKAQTLYDDRDIEERATVSASSVYANVTVTNDLETR